MIKKYLPKSTFFDTSLLVVYAYFFWLMLKLTWQYIPVRSDVAFLMIKQTVVSRVGFYLPVFYLHVYSAIFVLLAGFTQFSLPLLRKYVVLHRILGRVYAFTVMFVAAPTGIIMGFYANGAWHTQFCFVLLGLLWFLFTLIGTIAIRRGQVVRHRAFMARSFALAVSAITLRAWKVVIVYFFHTAPMDTYQIIAWLGWIPNLLIAEYYFIKKTPVI